MEYTLKFLSDHIGSKIMIGLLALSAIATSGITGAKLITTMNSDETVMSRVPDVSVQMDETVPQPSVTRTAVTSTPSRLPINEKANPTVRQNQNPTPLPTAFPFVSKPTIAAQGVSDVNACIITVFGQQYDVTAFRSTHSGGDIFRCGTDMSQSYQQKHGSNTSRLGQFLIRTSTGGQTVGLQPTVNQTIPTGFSMSEENDEDNWLSEAEKKEMEAQREAAKKAAESNETSEDDH